MADDVTFNKSLRDALNKMDDDARKAAQNFAELLRPSPADAGFIPPVTIPSRAQTLVDSIMETIEEWRKALPEDKTFVIGMEIPDGRYMIARKLGWVGNECFVAHGWVDGVACMVTGHTTQPFGASWR